MNRTRMLAIGLCTVALGFFVYSKLRSGGSGEGGGADELTGGIRTRQGGGIERGKPYADVGPTTNVEFATGAQDQRVSGQLENLDAAEGDWETELLSAAAGAALGEILGGDLAAVANGFSSSGLGSNDLVEVFAHGDIAVRRAVDRGAAVVTGDRSSLQEALGGEGVVWSHKITRIRQSEGSFSTRVLVMGHRGDDPVEQSTSVWDCEWSGGGGGVKLERLVVSSHETVSGQVLLEDVSASAFAAGNPADEFPMTHWAQRLTKIDGTDFFGHHGVAVGDADGDGRDDLYVCDGGGLPNRLYLQNADGRVREVAGTAGVDWLESTRSALFADLDNDGDQDLVVASVALLLIMENRGDAKFELRGGLPGLADPHSLSAADFDKDGDLDLFVCNYGAGSGVAGQRGFEAGAPLPFNDARNGGRNALLRNHGKLRFVDVADEVGLAAGGDRWSFSAAWEDYDNDGDQDLYVANDFGRNNLFRNDGGRFSDVAAVAGVEDRASGMSVAWGDVDHDGQMDLYVGNMFSSAGGRIAFQRQFAHRNQGATADLQRMARGNTLFLGGGSGGFRDVSESAAVNVGLWAWSSQFADLNNDGWQDLVAANGYLTNGGAGSDL